MTAARFPDSIAAGPVSLRRRQPSDVSELLVAIERSIDEVSAFLAWAAHGVPSEDALRALIETTNADFDAGRGFEYVVRDASSSELVGETGGELRGGEVAVEIGYWVRTDRAGRGIATACAAALTTMAFDALPNIERVEIRMDRGNVRSRRVPARLGFRLVGAETFATEPLAGQTGVGDIWAIDRAGWPTARRGGR